MRTEEAQFKTYRDALTVDGSFITEVHGVALVGGEKHKLATASFWTSELNEFTTGPNMINGTCGDRGQFFLGTGGYKKCEEMEILVRFSSARFRVPGWVIKVAAAPVFGRISGPRHRLDVSLHAHGDEAALAQTHGLVGQSFAWRTARDGKRDLYPSEGRFRTSAMAEGAIEGNRPCTSSRVRWRRSLPSRASTTQSSRCFPSRPAQQRWTPRQQTRWRLLARRARLLSSAGSPRRGRRARRQWHHRQQAVEDSALSARAKSTLAPAAATRERRASMASLARSHRKDLTNAARLLHPHRRRPV